MNGIRPKIWMWPLATCLAEPHMGDITPHRVFGSSGNIWPVKMTPFFQKGQFSTSNSLPFKQWKQITLREGLRILKPKLKFYQKLLIQKQYKEHRIEPQVSLQLLTNITPEKLHINWTYSIMLNTHLIHYFPNPIIKATRTLFKCRCPRPSVMENLIPQFWGSVQGSAVFPSTWGAIFVIWCIWEAVV